MRSHIDGHQGSEATLSSHAYLKDSRAAAMAILLGMGMSSACAATPNVPKSNSPRDVTVQIPAPVETAAAEKAEETPVEQEPEDTKPVEKYERSKFAEDTRSDLNEKLCKGEYPKGVIPEIRGVIEGDNFEAIAIEGAPDAWDFRFNPALNLEQSKKITGISWDPNAGFKLMSTGYMKFSPNPFGDNASSWLLEKIKNVDAFKNVKIVWSAKKGEDGIKPDTDCNQLVIPYLKLRVPPAVPTP